MAIVFLILFLFFGCPAYAACDAGDLDAAIRARFGANRITGVAVNDGRVVRIDFYYKTQPEERVEITNFANTFDLSQPGRLDVQKQIEAEKQAIADDPDLTDAQQSEIKIKLERAQGMSDLSATKAKLEEAQQAKANAKTESKINLELRPVRPRLTRLPHVGETYAEYKRTSP